MYLNKICLKNFRNYIKLELEPSKGINVFIGSNAQGKTNLLEAIYYLSSLTSHRTISDNDLIRWEESFFYIQGAAQDKEKKINLEIGFASDKYRKEIRLNRKLLERIYHGMGEINTVLFTPEDLYLIKGSPVIRRNFLDREILQINNLYGQYLRQYNKTLRQRNRVLKDIKGGRGKKFADQLEVWDKQLAEAGSYLIFKRKEIVKKLSLLARLQHRKIAGEGENLVLKYICSLKNEGDLKREEVEKLFLESLKEAKKEELRTGTTLIGPHRDDLGISINDKETKIFGSQGQQRTAVLSLKLSEIELIKGEKGNYPILLLDDVFSELDDLRKNKLLELIKGRVQTFITGTNLNLFKGNIFKDSTLFYVEEGKVKKWTN